MARRRWISALVAVTVALPASASAAPDLRRSVTASPGAKPVAERPTNGENVCFIGGDRPCPKGLRLEGWSIDEAPASPACSQHFCVHWLPRGKNAPNPDDRDGDGEPDFVELTLTIAERSYEVQVGRLGWNSPLPDRGKGGNDRTDFYLFNLDRILCCSGVAITDNAPGEGARHRSAFFIIDDDYDDPFYIERDRTPRDVLEVLVPHEFAHVLQVRYEQFQDDWMYEATADWAASEVYPNPGLYAFVDPLIETTDQPLDRFGLRSYSLSIWAQWLARRLGPAVIRRAWEISDRFPKQGRFSLVAFSDAIRSVSGGRSSFTREFARFAVATAEWDRFPHSNLYDDLAREKRLRADGERDLKKLDHASWAMYDVTREGSAASYTLTAEIEGGTRSALALVGRRRGGAVTETIARARDGGKLSVTLAAPRRGFDRITAVIVNADARARDNRTFEVSVRSQAE